MTTLRPGPVSAGSHLGSRPRNCAKCSSSQVHRANGVIPLVGDVQRLLIESHSLRIVESSGLSITEARLSCSSYPFDCCSRWTIETCNDHPVIRAVGYGESISRNGHLSGIAELPRNLCRRVTWKMEWRVVQYPARTCGIDQSINEWKERFRHELAGMCSDDIACGIDGDNCRPR